MESKEKILAGGIVVALLLSIFAVFSGGTDGRDGTDGTDGKNGKGAIVGPDAYLPYQAINDVQRFYNRLTGLNSASTTVCAIKSPSATSTLVSGSIKYFVGSSTIAVYTEIGKGATQFATTTSLGIATLASGGQGTMHATTPVGGSFDEAMVFAPSQWMVVNVNAGDVTGFAPTGACQAVFERI